MHKCVSRNMPGMLRPALPHIYMIFHPEYTHFISFHRDEEKPHCVTKKFITPRKQKKTDEIRPRITKAKAPTTDFDRRNTAYLYRGGRALHVASYTPRRDIAVINLPYSNNRASSPFFPFLSSYIYGAARIS